MSWPERRTITDDAPRSPIFARTKQTISRAGQRRRCHASRAKMLRKIAASKLQIATRFKKSVNPLSKVKTEFVPRAASQGWPQRNGMGGARAKIRTISLYNRSLHDVAHGLDSWQRRHICVGPQAH